MWNCSSRSMSLSTSRLRSWRKPRRIPGMRRMVSLGQGRRSRRLEDAGHRFRVALPGRDFGAKLCAAAGRELVELRLAIVFGESPVALDPSLPLEAVECRVQ